MYPRDKICSFDNILAELENSLIGLQMRLWFWVIMHTHIVHMIMSVLVHYCINLLYRVVFGVLGDL